MTESTQTKAHEHKHDGSCSHDKMQKDEGSCATTDKAKKAEGESCSTEGKKTGSCG